MHVRTENADRRNNGIFPRNTKKYYNCALRHSGAEISAQKLSDIWTVRREEQNYDCTKIDCVFAAKCPIAIFF